MSQELRKALDILSSNPVLCCALLGCGAVLCLHDSLLAWNVLDVASTVLMGHL